MPSADRDLVQAMFRTLHEALALLRAFRKDWRTIADWEPIWKRADELVEKHEPTDA